MFRYAAVAVTAATLVVSGTALGAVQSGRVATANYTAGSSQTGVVIVGADVAGQAVGGATIATRLTERTISVTAADDSGRAVAGDVSQRDASGGVHHLTRFCGATSRPVRLYRPGTAVTITMLNGACANGISVPTAGTVTATLAR